MRGARARHTTAMPVRLCVSVAAAAVLGASGCNLYFEEGDDSPFPPADARRPVDARFPIIDAADDLNLTLHPQPADRPRGQMQLLGFGELRDADLSALTGVKARLIADDGKAAAVADIDEIGNFILGPVPPGSYTLELTFPTRLVVVPDCGHNVFKEQWDTFVAEIRAHFRRAGGTV